MLEEFFKHGLIQYFTPTELPIFPFLGSTDISPLWGFSIFHALFNRSILPTD
jgi:hypothetical protein